MNLLMEVPHHIFVPNLQFGLQAFKFVVQNVHWCTLNTSRPILRDNSFTAVKRGPGLEKLKSRDNISWRTLVHSQQKREVVIARSGQSVVIDNALVINPVNVTDGPV